MDLTIYPSKLAGEVTPPSSKSQAHRALIAAAPRRRDQHPFPIWRTHRTSRPPAGACLPWGLWWRTWGLEYPGPRPGELHPQAGPFPTLDCGESGSTLRFLIPAALLVQGGAAFTGRGRLMERPLAPYETLFREKGIGWGLENGVLTPGQRTGL